MTRKEKMSTGTFIVSIGEIFVALVSNKVGLGLKTAAQLKQQSEDVA